MEKRHSVILKVNISKKDIKKMLFRIKREMRKSGVKYDH